MEPALAWIRARTSFVPEVGLVLGSGLGQLADAVVPELGAAYAELPGFPRATAPGHAGRLVLGTLEGRRVCVFRGRFHLYEGYLPREATAPIRLLDELGAGVLVVTNAAGIVNPRFRPGTLMLLDDQINLLWSSPLVGRSPDEVRDPFPDMSRPFDPELRELVRDAALALGVPLVEGVYAAVSGPSYETPAEVRFLRRFGADAVGMSTVPEVLVARERGLRVLGLSCLTNLAAGLSPGPLTHEEVLEAGARAAPRLEALIRRLLRRLPGSAPVGSEGPRVASGA
ncbi:MAG: purine-nucleoside phosphorylase [Gemmatimonadota bacterium]